MLKHIIAASCLVCFSTQDLAAEPFVGKTISQIALELGVELERGTVIDEPPAVPRGIYFTPREGVEVQVFITRGQVPLTFQGGNNLTLYKDLKAIGFRKVENGKIYCEGDVMWHFQCQTR